MATTNVNEEDKGNIFVSFFKLIKVLILLIFPILKAFQFNKYLSLCAKINKDKGGIFNFIKESILFIINTKIRSKNNNHFDDVIATVSLYTKQKTLNLILGVLFSLPLIISLVFANVSIKKDIYLTKRIQHVSESKYNLLEKGKLYYYTIGTSIKDDEREQNRKYYTKVILTRAGLVIGLGLILQLIGGYTFVYGHPQEEKNQMLRNLLISNGVRRKEEDENMVAFYTPMGVLVDITGSMPTDIVHNDRIWSSLNIKINKRDWLNDPSKRSLVFFKTDYELKNAYMYEDIKEK